MAAQGTSFVMSAIHIERLQPWFMALAEQAAWVEFLVLAACIGLAWLLTSLLRFGLAGRL